MSQASVQHLPLEVSVLTTTGIKVDDPNSEFHLEISQDGLNCHVESVGPESKFIFLCGDGEAGGVPMLTMSEAAGVVIENGPLVITQGIEIMNAGIVFRANGGNFNMNPNGCRVNIYGANLPQVAAGLGAGTVYINAGTGLLSVSTD